MARPKLHLLGPARYADHMDFRFVDCAGKLLKSKTWELRREADEKHQVLLLQANARLVGKLPALEELGKNYVALTLVVESLPGELSTSVFPVHQPDAVNQQVAAFPLTLRVIVARDGINFSCYTATPKNHE